MITDYCGVCGEEYYRSFGKFPYCKKCYLEALHKEPMSVGEFFSGVWLLTKTFFWLMFHQDRGRKK